MLLAILRAILTWLTIGVPVALLVLWDALAAWRGGAIVVVGARLEKPDAPV